MNESIIRLQQVQLQNFKNVKNGIVEIQSYMNKDHFSHSADVLGIYGQNGSGKTSLVDAMQLLQTLLKGQSLPMSAIDYILVGEEFSKLNYVFSVAREDKRFLVDYSFSLKKENDKVFINEESLQMSSFINGIKESKKSIILYKYQNDEVVFTPKIRYEEILKADKNNMIELGVAKKLSILNETSFIFGSEGFKLFVAGFRKESKECSMILESLKIFALENLTVINNRNNAVINLNIIQPFVFKLNEENVTKKGTVGIALDKPCIIENEVFDIVHKIINQMNVVLSAIIPHFTIEIRNHGTQSLDNGEIGIKVELMSIRSQSKIPLRCESEGIKKIISILNSIIQMYNNEKNCVVVDELDAGIFEYLLGEILCSLETAGKGQFIFTSHNLRALEKLNKNSIIFTTVNPENRYIRFANVKSSNNLRDLYIRSINLGGQREVLYNETDAYEIQRAFRWAGREWTD